MEYFGPLLFVLAKSGVDVPGILGTIIELGFAIRFSS
jgi:hypothetical protein